MEKFVLGLFLFYALAAVCRANVFSCYRCEPKGDSYPTDQCEKDQTKVDCNSTTAMPMTCIKGHSKKTDGNEVEARACVTKSYCEEKKNMCGDKDKMAEQKIESCEVACCDTDLCNSAVPTFAEVTIMMMGSLCVFTLV